MKKKNIASSYDSTFGLAFKIPDLSDYFIDEFGVFGSDYRKAKPFKKLPKKQRQSRETELFAGYQPLNDREALEQDKYADRNYQTTGYDGYNITGKQRQQ